MQPLLNLSIKFHTTILSSSLPNSICCRGSGTHTHTHTHTRARARLLHAVSVSIYCHPSSQCVALYKKKKKTKKNQIHVLLGTFDPVHNSPFFLFCLCSLTTQRVGRRRITPTTTRSDNKRTFDQLASKPALPSSSSLPLCLLLACAHQKSGIL